MFTNLPNVAKRIVKNIILDALKIVSPTSFLQVLDWLDADSEPEKRLLPFFCDKSKIAIDIGADSGRYTIPMLMYSAKCYAFEPRIDAARALGAKLSPFIKKLSIQTCALSDTAGIGALKKVKSDFGRSTLEQENTVEDNYDIEINSVPIKRLDDYTFEQEISCIKIDVEGHEESVLRGAQKTIAKFLPVLIIEVEDRHRQDAVNSTASFLKNLGYEGYFMLGEKIKNIREFEMDQLQNPQNIDKGIYVNNFFFIPDKKKEKYLGANGILSKFDFTK